ncbi:MAG: DUF5320 domain-containing protein [Pirellulales bacterium]|nr:DUF5320 domain-containing protein [Pirellulales bacterium]
MGPMTGRAAGYCAGYPVPGFANALGGRGFGGFGGGRGRGWRNQYYATGLTGWQRAGFGRQFAGVGVGAAAGVPPEQEMEALRQQAEVLGQTLDEIRRRLDQLGARSQKTESQS